MGAINQYPKLLRGREVDEMRGRSRSRRYVDLQDGVLPPPIHGNSKDARYVADEVAACIRAEISGASRDELRELVRRLVEARKQVA